MIKIPTFFIILALVAINFAPVACAYAGDIAINDDVNAVVVLDANSDDIPLQQSIQSYQCCHHAGFHTGFDKVSVNGYGGFSANYISSKDSSYLSAFNSPPFQPPKV